jgi:hypothetical protein
MDVCFHACNGNSFACTHGHSLNTAIRITLARLFQWAIRFTLAIEITQCTNSNFRKHPVLVLSQLDPFSYFCLVALLSCYFCKRDSHTFGLRPFPLSSFACISIKFNFVPPSSPKDFSFFLFLFLLLDISIDFWTCDFSSRHGCL